MWFRGPRRSRTKGAKTGGRSFRAKTPDQQGRRPNSAMSKIPELFQENAGRWDGRCTTMR